MPFRYALNPNSPDSHQSSPWWLLVIVRMARVRTFDRAEVLKPGSTRMDVSDPQARQDPVAERSPIVLSSQVISWSTTSAKSSHTATAQFTVAPGLPLAELVAAGDWVFFWALDDRADHERVMAKVRQAATGLNIGTGANGFRDGLKFVGRINAPRRITQVDGNGKLSTRYQLTAVGFGEFDSKIYYTPASEAVARETVNSALFQHLTIGNDLDHQIASGLPHGVRDHVKLYLKTFLGDGPGADSRGFDSRLVDALGTASITQDVLDSGLLRTPNDQFLVPRTAALLLGIAPDADGQTRYVSLLRTFIGVQGPSAGEGSAQTAGTAGAGFALDSVADPTGTFFHRYDAMNDVAVWDLLQQYSNAPLNEMFVTLRADPDGNVMPSFVLRQTPISSGPAKLALERASFPCTAFTDLPRWVVHPGLLIQENVGASDSLRHNYIAVQGQDVTAAAGGPSVERNTFNSVVAPPIGDLADINRSGLRPYVRPLSSDISGLTDPRAQLGRAFNQFLADILLDQHLRWSGSLQLFGIQEPICVGDNLEWDRVVYHIESVMHSGWIDGNGQKSFRTSLQLSSGVHVLSDVLGDNVFPHEVSPEDLEPGLAQVVSRRYLAVDSEHRAGESEGELEVLAQQQSALLQLQDARRATEAARQVEVRVGQVQLGPSGLPIPTDRGL